MDNFGSIDAIWRFTLRVTSMQPKEKPRPVQTSRGELCLFLSFSLD